MQLYHPPQLQPAAVNTTSEVKKKIRLQQQNLQLNKRLQFQPSIAHQTTKNNTAAKKFTIIHQQMLSLQNPAASLETNDHNYNNTSATQLKQPANNTIQYIPIAVPLGGGQQQLQQTVTNENIRTHQRQIPVQRMVGHLAQSLETSQERRLPLHQQQLHNNILMDGHNSIGIRGSLERPPVLKKDYSLGIHQKLHRQLITATTSKPRHPSRGQSNPQQEQQNTLNININGYQQPLTSNTISHFMIHKHESPNVMKQSLQQYSSIPMKATSTNRINNNVLNLQSSTSGCENGSINIYQQKKGINKQASALMKMYGNNGNVYRKFFKSVERKQQQPTHPVVAAAGYTTNYQMYKPSLQYHPSASNSKLSTSYQLNNNMNVKMSSEDLDISQRRSLGVASLNNSMISCLQQQKPVTNIPNGLLYTNQMASIGGSMQNLTSADSQRGNRNLNQSMTYTKFRVRSNNLMEQQQYSFRKTGRVSSKNMLRQRYNMIQSIQPLEDIRLQFYQHQKQAVQQKNELKKKHSLINNTNVNHTNLLIQQNEVTLMSNDMLNRSSGEDKFRLLTKNAQSKYPNNSASSSRRLPVKANQQQILNYSTSLEQTPNSSSAAATDTVLYLQQQEFIQKSKLLFEDGKKHLLQKDYKEATKSFTMSLKYLASNKDSKYYRAICYLDSEQPRKCIQDLSELVEADPGYNQTVYVVMSIAYRRENDLNNALRALTKGIQKFPKYVEAYQARGQINIFMKRFDKALIDFQHIIKLKPQNGAGLIGLADSMKGIGNFKGALQAYSQAMQVDPNCRSQAMLKRAMLLYQLKNYDESLRIFEELLNESDSNARAHFFKGKILKKQAFENEAILHFEQVIKNATLNNNPASDSGHNTSSLSISTSACDNEIAGNALFEIAKIRINQRDFYEAFHNLQRALHFDFKAQGKFLQYKTFVEGVLLLMKRKVKKGIKMLSTLVDGQQQLDSNNNSMPALAIVKDSQSVDNNRPQAADSQLPLKPDLIYLIYVYRSYGFIINNQFDVSVACALSIIQRALGDLTKAQKIKKLDEACVYNRFIAQALLKIDKRDLAGVQSILQQAELKFPRNKDPYRFQAICVLQGVLNELVDIDNPRKRKAVEEAMSILDRALGHSPKDLQLIFLRGLLRFYMHDFYSALVDLDAVVDLDEEPTAKHYLARGRCHACLSMFHEAIQDLSKAIELDEELADAYFNRGKCAYLLGDTALAFLDFQKLILLEPKNPQVHIYAGNLLMTTGSYEDATKAFTNADSVQKSPLAFYQRARCHIALANLDSALKDLCLVIERSPQDKIAYVDRECLQALKNAISVSQQVQNGFDSQPFEKGAVIYTKLLNTAYDIESNIHASISAIRQHQQIIPNVKRIKIEKVRALRRRRVKDEIYGTNGGKRSRKIRGLFDLKNDEQDTILREQASTIQPYSYYKENIFGQEDFYLYRAVMFFYCGEYLKAIADFELSIQKKQEQKDENTDDTQSQGSTQTDLSDVGLCSLNVHECCFNIAICFIQLKEYQQAFDKVNRLIKEVPNRYQKHLYLLRMLLNQALGNSAKAQKDMDFLQAMCAESQQQQSKQQSASSTGRYFDQTVLSEYFDQRKPLSLNPFPLGTRLCTQFPEVRVSIPGAPAALLMRPSFSFPFVKPPNMIPNVEEAVMIQEFSLKTASPPKPEAPWIRRCDYGIKFTDEIIENDNGGATPKDGITETEVSTTNKCEDSDSHNNHEDEEDSAGDHNSSQNEEEDGEKYQREEVDEEQNERYYLRSFVKQMRRKMTRAYSDRLPHRKQCSFYNHEEYEHQDRGNHHHQEEAFDDEQETENPTEENDDGSSSTEREHGSDTQEVNEGSQIQEQLREHLYGAAAKSYDEESSKNIIIDADVEDESIVS